MALSQQDIIHGVDLSVLNPIAGSDINNVTDQATPVLDGIIGVTEWYGKGFVLVTKDTALNVADVPDATAVNFTKWKRYLWIRIPHNSATNLTPAIYSWNDATVSGPLLKWMQIVVDLTNIQNQINAIATQATNAQSTAANASSQAAQALTNSTNALTKATDANTLATQANTSANAAKTEADTATTAVATLSTNLTTLQTTVNTINNVNLPALTLLTQAIAIIVEEANSGVDLGNIVAGQNSRVLTNIIYDAQSMVSLTGAGKIQFAKAGTYYVHAVVPFVNNPTTGVSLAVQSFIKKNSDNSILAQGSSAAFNVTAGVINVGVTQFSVVSGVITVLANDVIRIDLHASNAIGTLGLHAQDGAIHFPAGTKEIYTTVIVQKLI